jgi:hypothetical protein
VLTNSGTGMQMHQELLNWARETYLGLAEKEPPPVALDETELRLYWQIRFGHLDHRCQRLPWLIVHARAPGSDGAGLPWLSGRDSAR